MTTSPPNGNAAAVTRKAPRTRSTGDTVQSLSRALRLMNTLATRDQGISLSELAQMTGLAVSTTHRLLTTLQQDRFVRFDAERGVWLIGVQAFVVGNAFLRSREITAVARPLMRQLMERSGETVNLAVAERGEAIYVAQVESRKLMRTITRPGGRAPMHCSGVGKALLSAMSSEEVAKIVETHGLPKETDKTIDSPARLAAELAAIRRRGYAVDDEENAIGLRCVAAVVYDEHSQAVAGVSLSGPKARIGDDAIGVLGAAIRETAERITAGLGGCAP